MYNLKELKELTNNFTNDEKINYSNIDSFIVKFLPQQYKNKWCVAQFKNNVLFQYDFDFSQTIYVGRTSYLEIKCNKHNIIFYQIASSFVKGMCGCKQCEKENRLINYSQKDKTINKILFLEKAINTHGNKYNYSLVKYTNSHTKIKILCPIHGEFTQMPSLHINQKCGCPKCGKEKLGKLFVKNFNERIKAFRTVHGNKYTYEQIIFQNKHQIVAICPIHGKWNIKPRSHELGRGCPKCADSTKTHDQFILEANDIHNNKYNYSLIKYINGDVPITIVCPIHGKFKQSPRSHIQGNGCRKCNMSKHEQYINKWLTLNKILFISEYTFNKHFSLKRGRNTYLRFDFYLPDYKLCIEYDGIHHFKEIKRSKNKNVSLQNCMERDDIKNAFCVINGIKLIRIPYWVKVTNDLLLYIVSTNLKGMVSIIK